jgi:hypothetical protein
VESWTENIAAFASVMTIMAAINHRACISASLFAITAQSSREPWRRRRGRRHSGWRGKRKPGYWADCALVRAVEAGKGTYPQIDFPGRPVASVRHVTDATGRHFRKPIDRMGVVFFVLSLAAVIVLFGSVIAFLGWLIIKALRVLRRLWRRLRAKS